MPRKIVKTETEILPDRTLPSETVDNDGPMRLEDSEGVADYLRQFSNEQFRVKVYKNTPRGSEYCCSGTTEIDEEFLIQFGGGDYELRVFVDGVRQDTVFIRIADRPMKNGGGGSDDFMRQQMTFMQSMLAAQKTTAPSSPILDVIEAVKSLQGLNAGKDPLDLVLKGMELAKNMNGGGTGDWKSGIVDGVKEIAKTAIPVLAAMAQPQQQHVQVQPQQQESPEMIQEQQLREGIAYLKGRAMSGMDCNLVIDWVVANSNDPQYTPFIKMVLQQDFDTFIKIDAEIAREPFLSWFRTLHSGLRDAFNEALNVGDSGGESRNVTDFTDHGTANTKRGKAK